MKKKVAIIQARIGSERLPGKVLVPIEGRTVLEWVIFRVKKSKLIDTVIVATSDSEKDVPIIELCDNLKVKYFRGPEDNVLERFYLAAKATSAGIVIRITADCPLLDAGVIDDILDIHFKRVNQFTANDTERSYPRGSDVEIINYELLELVRQQAWSQKDKEHVTSFIYNNKNKFKIELIRAPKELERPNLRLCLDEEDDLVLLKMIYRHFFPLNYFTLKEVIEYMDKNPKVAKINSHVKQRTS